MASNDSPSDEIIMTVLVTGFAPFRAEYPVNPSCLIVKSLSQFLPSSHGSSKSASKIRVLTHPAPIPVSYDAVRNLVPLLWKEHGGVDVMIHIGMSNSNSVYALERRGHRDGYLSPDVDNEPPPLGAEEGGIWEGCPENLETALDAEDVWRRWATHLPDVSVELSKDAGNYLCDFIYYSSLCELWKRGVENKTAVFLHVPVVSQPKDIEKGKRVAEELIMAIASSWKRNISE